MQTQQQTSQKSQSKNEFSLKRIEPTSFVFSRQKLLGKGAFGEVYLGFDERNKIPVAIKTISSARASQSNINEHTLAQKIVGELSNMQLARNERLVKLISPHQSSKNMYLVCEYCNEGSLKDYLSKKGILAENQALHWLRDILEGFKNLHEKKIVHRDLKPANMLLHNHRIKIGDLGFSKNLEMHEQLLTSIVGSPLYMSPQILSNSTYTQKTDIWSLGIIMYEMLVGEAPWRVNSLKEIQQKVRHRPEFPKNVYISESTRHLILSMLESEQKNRIGWDYLFQNYLSHSKIQQENGAFFMKMKQAKQHFQLSIAIQNQQHIVSLLIKNNRVHYQFWQSCTTARQFFQKIKQIKKQQQHLEQITNFYVSQRNKTGFLMRLFVELHENCDQLHSPLVYASMLMIVKYCISGTQELMSDSNSNMENYAQFVQSFYYKNFIQLMKLDLQLLQSLFSLFFSQIFVPKLKIMMNQNEFTKQVKLIQSNLNSFFKLESASLKYTQFCLKNQLRKLFNAFKQVQNIPNKWLLIPRMIYQLQKQSKTHIFQNQKQKSNIAKKLQTWCYDQKFKIKIQQTKAFQIQSINSFISRQVKWNPYASFGLTMNLGI